MGKRSKKGAAAKAKAGTDGSVPTTVSTSSASSKQRCAGCCALLKELAKAHQCPGCSQLFCWRCEKKYFEECPNGAACVRQVRRCDFCWNGTIFENSCGSLLFKTGDSQERAHHFYVRLRRIPVILGNVLESRTGGPPLTRSVKRGLWHEA